MTNKNYSKLLENYKKKDGIEKFNKIICVDFDGVIHSYQSKWVDEQTIPDPPVRGAFEFLLKFLPPDPDHPENYDGPIAVIYSSRSQTYTGIKAMKDWFLKHGFPYEYIERDILKFPSKKPAAFITIDDRAICFKGQFPSIDEIESFKPWNK